MKKQLKNQKTSGQLAVKNPVSLSAKSYSSKTLVKTPSSASVKTLVQTTTQTRTMATNKPLIIDGREFSALRDELAQYDATRDMIIKECRDITKLSKQAIYSLHRDEVQTAKQQLIDARKIIVKLLADIGTDPTLRTGGFSASLEEYAEAQAFMRFLEDGTLITCKELEVVEAEEYLLGLCDFTGELMRYSVLCATKRDRKRVQAARDLLDAIYGQFVQFDFRNGELRKKYDSIKYNLQKVENVLYDLALNPRDNKIDE